jgi:hypothetical protein
MNERILPSWRDGSTRDAIVGFLDQAADIAPRDRVAVFDNDGTMWAEKPKYTQLEFWLLELKRAMAENPDLATKPEFEAVLAGDEAAIQAIGIEDVATAFLDLFAGITPREFDAKVASFFEEQVHSERGVHYRQTRYQPMLELMSELRGRDFDFYIVSAGGTEFVRAADRASGHPRPAQHAGLRRRRCAGRCPPQPTRSFVLGGRVSDAHRWCWPQVRPLAPPDAVSPPVRFTQRASSRRPHLQDGGA